MVVRLWATSSLSFDRCDSVFRLRRLDLRYDFPTGASSRALLRFLWCAL